MAQDTHIKVAGSWKSIDDCSIKADNAWKQVQKIWAKVGGTWEMVWQYLTAFLVADGTSFHQVNADVACHSGISLNSNGTTYAIGSSGPGNVNPTKTALTPWLVAGTAAEFWARHSTHTGTALDGSSSATGTWLQLSTTRNWYIADTSGSATPDPETCQFTIEIATDSLGANVIATRVYTPTADLITV